MSPKEFAAKLARFRAELESGGSSEKAKIADRALKLIYARVKKGYGTTGDDDAPLERSLRDLSSKPYLEFRKRVKAAGLMGKLGRPGVSNLTLTGQMLDSMKAKINKNIVLYVDDSKRWEPVGDGEGGITRTTYGKTNAEVAGHIHAKGEIFFALTVAEQMILQKMYDQWVNRLIRKYFGG